MPNLSQRYIAALAELSQFHYVRGEKNTLTHVLSGVQVAPESDDEAAKDQNYLHLTFAGGHHVDVNASHYLELMLTEDAAHQIQAAGNGIGEIHEFAKKTLLRLAKQYRLLN